MTARSAHRHRADPGLQPKSHFIPCFPQEEARLEIIGSKQELFQRQTEPVVPLYRGFCQDQRLGRYPLSVRKIVGYNHVMLFYIIARLRSDGIEDRVLLECQP
ncbi:hypothetical protein HFO50_32295 [Rhizobium leguminosarum]|uniref:hypothetical protein n=1 Tax=Rhizobium leguminosarum TaxID=384 RepID=UPI001C967C09|nr:hypothetical protein [Rhizobium leguminosarum]MBY5605751.1 hypothetical protein [Rhizobium leguminosarum]